MNNLDKEFVPYEQALALKELGFDEPCIGFYKGNYDVKAVDQHWGSSISGISKKGGYRIDDLVLAPTFSQAFRWFRETCDIIQTISRDGSLAKEGMWAYTIITDGIYFNDGYNTYEEAEIACLQKLIEIVKTEQNER